MSDLNKCLCNMENPKVVKTVMPVWRRTGSGTWVKARPGSLGERGPHVENQGSGLWRGGRLGGRQKLSCRWQRASAAQTAMQTSPGCWECGTRIQKTVQGKSRFGGHLRTVNVETVCKCGISHRSAEGEKKRTETWGWRGGIQTWCQVWTHFIYGVKEELRRKQGSSQMREDGGNSSISRKKEGGDELADGCPDLSLSLWCQHTVEIGDVKMSWRSSLSVMGRTAWLPLLTPPVSPCGALGKWHVTVYLSLLLHISRQ